MKKVLLILVLFLSGYLIYYFAFNKNNNLSKEFDENSKFENNIPDNRNDELTSNDDENIISEFMSNDSFDSDKLDNYLAFYNENQDVTIDNIIKVVNNDIDTISGFVYDDIIIELLDEKYYIFDNTVRYIDYFHNNNELSAKEIVANVNSNIDNEFYTNTKPTDLKNENLILVNKYNYLESDYEPDDLVYIEQPYSYKGGYLKEEVYEAFKEMVDDASYDGIELYSVSPYRSYDTQDELYEWYASYDGYDNADTYSARAGFSEHQTGLAVDINSTEDSFTYTSEAEWLFDNAHKYGFILRYPLGKEYITGYQYEPWHYRYVGVAVAAEIYELDITFEEYYAYFVD